MSSLRHDTLHSNSVSLSVQSEPKFAQDGRPRRNLSLMRKFEVAALLPDLTVSFKQHVAPATAVFEECATAFARGTLIQTVNGPVAIEDLMPGDYIETAHGTESVMWIGSTTYVPGHGDEVTSLSHLTRVTADAYGFGRPAMDLLVGPAARMIIRNPKFESLLGQKAVLAPIADYVDGDRFLEVSPGGAVQMYHLMTGHHTTIEIGGMEVETYHPGQNAAQALGSNMRKLFLSMFPHLRDLEDFGEVGLTRTTRSVIDSVVGF